MRSHTMRRWLALCAALVLVVAACADGDDEPDDTDEVAEEVDASEVEEPEDGDAQAAEPVDGGTVLFGDEQEPPILNGLLLDGTGLVTAKVFNTQFLGAYHITPEFGIEPRLIDGEAEVTEDPFTVTYTIREDAAWSDGEPVTAEDFVFTYETMIDETWRSQVANPEPYLLIEDHQVEDDKTVTFTFAAPYAAWREMFPNVLPRHVLEDEDFETVMNDALPEVGSGPFLFEEWVEGVQLRMVRNEAYWEGDVALEELVMRYVDDTTTLVNQLRGGEIHMFDPHPQVELVEHLDEISDRVTYEVEQGESWEHIDFNTLVPGLDKDYVRQAIAYAIDRETIAETLIAPINPEVEVLQNPIYMTNMEEYEPHFDRYSYQPERAVALLEENGCERGDGDVWECDGDRLSFRLGTTGGNERRELAQQLIQSDLGDIGIEISIDNDDGTAFFDRLNTPENCEGVCDYDLSLFAWVTTADPTADRNIFSCAYEEGEEPAPRPQNWMAWCDEEASALMDEAARTVDPDRQAELWNETVEVIAEGVPTIPLFQNPQLLAWDNTITGPRLNPTTQTSLWNVAEWTMTE